MKQTPKSRKRTDNPQNKTKRPRTLLDDETRAMWWSSKTPSGPLAVQRKPRPLRTEHERADNLYRAMDDTYVYVPERRQGIYYQRENFGDRRNRMLSANYILREYPNETPLG